MKSLIGYNIHPKLTYGRGYSDDEKRRMWEHLERLQPASLLFIDWIDAAKEAKRRLPNCRIVFREYRPADGRFFMDMSPQQFYDSHIRFAEGGVIVSCMNEPTGYGQQNTPEDLERIADFMAIVMGLFGRQGASICGPEFGVGHPDLNRLSELDSMWEMFKTWPLHFYGAHEYGTYHGMQYTDSSGKRDVFPYRVGRYKSIFTYVRTKFAYELPILINEWGIDSSFYEGDDTNKRGWRDAGITEMEYAQQLIQAAKEVYTEPNVKGLNIFSHGNTGTEFTSDDWKTHDVSFLPTFQATLEAYSQEQATMLPLTNDARWVETVNDSGAAYRLRLSALVNNSNEIGWIRAGEKFSYIDILTDKEWMYGKNAAGIIGYVNRGVLQIEQPPEPPPPYVPPVEPEEPPTTPSEPSEEELMLIELRRAWVAVGEACNKLAIASARYSDFLKRREDKIREERLKPAA